MADPPSWLADLVNNAATHVYAVDILAPLGCHYYHNRARDQWEVTLFASRTVTVGGKRDGRVTPSRFRTDLTGLMEIFGDEALCNWQALSLGPDDDLGPHISIESQFEDHSVWLRILATAPPRYEEGRSVHAYTMKLEDHW